MYIEQVKRATGRTTRMLKDVAEHVEAGELCLIVAAGAGHANQLLEQVAKYTPKFVRAVTFYQLAHAQVGTYDRYRLFWDHHAIEECYRNTLNDWIRYDEPTPQPNWVVDGSCPKEAGTYLITLQSDGRRFTQVTHWDSLGGWLAPQGKQRIVAWAPMPKPFGYTGEPT